VADLLFYDRWDQPKPSRISGSFDRATQVSKTLAGLRNLSTSRTIAVQLSARCGIWDDRVSSGPT
jgi:hypothetical protein